MSVEIYPLNEEIKIIFKGLPIGEPRHRVNFYQRNFFNPKHLQKNSLTTEAKEKYKGKLEEKKVFEIIFEFYFSQPKSWSKKKKSLELYPNKKPDLDNLCKFYMDVLTGVIWKDDAQVWKLSAEKKWSDIGHERVEVVIKNPTGL